MEGDHHDCCGAPRAFDLELHPRIRIILKHTNAIDIGPLAILLLPELPLVDRKAKEQVDDLRLGVDHLLAEVAPRLDPRSIAQEYRGLTGKRHHIRDGMEGAVVEPMSSASVWHRGGGLKEGSTVLPREQVGPVRVAQASIADRGQRLIKGNGETPPAGIPPFAPLWTGADARDDSHPLGTPPLSHPHPTFDAHPLPEIMMRLVPPLLAALVVVLAPAAASAQGTVRCSSDTYGNSTYTRCSDGTRSTADRYGSTTYIRDNTGRRATIDTYGTGSYYRDNLGTRGTLDTYGTTSYYRDNRGTRATTTTYGTMSTTRITRPVEPVRPVWP